MSVVAARDRRGAAIRRTLLVFALGLALTACASRGGVPPPKPAPAPREGGAGPGVADPPARDLLDRIVATVGEREIRESDIGEFVIRYFRDRANEALTHLIDTIVLEKEARTLGISVSPRALTEEVDRQLQARERTIRAQFGPDVTLADYLTERYGVTLAEHREDLSALVRTRLLRDRVIRYSALREERVRVRDTVFPTLETAERAARSAREGADLGRLGAESGLSPGEVLPPLAAGDFVPAELGEAAFGLATGEVSDPVPVETGERTVYHVLKAVSRHPARTGTWEELRAEITAGIEERPVEQWEYTRWAREMREKHRTRVLR